MVTNRSIWVIVTTDGETLVVELDDDDTTAVVTDEDGNEYYVADGVVVTGEAALADATGVSTSEVANLDEMRLGLPDIEFTPAELQKYGFDKPIHTELNNSYELIEVRGEPRRIPWKALQTGISEPVDAIIPVSDKYDAQAIGFKTASSRFMSKPTGSQNNKTVNAISVLPGVSETLTAFYSMKDTSGNTVEEELGMLNLIAYDKIIRNVYLVPVNTDVSNTEFEMIKQTLNTTYAQAVSEWSLTLHPRFDVAQSEWDVSPEDEIFQAEDENNRMDYTREQKEIYRAFKSQMDPDNDAWYVFIIPHTTNNTGINGYAIFGKQWVYIYKSNTGNDMAHTITHELGHAAFSLRHTFSRENEYVVTQNSTQNLMDYAGGTELNKYQWDYIHNPEFTFAFLQDESEGEMNLPCLGWFDECDDVLKILETFRSARIKGNQVKIKGQTKTEEQTLIANSVKIGETDYNRIRLIYKPKAEDYLFNPTIYTDYDQQFFVADGSVDWQRGFIYSENGAELFKILIDDEVEKIGKLKEYLFGSVSENDEQEDEEVDTEQILEDAKTATQVASKFTSGTACNICVRSALYIIKKDSALFPETGSGYNDPTNDFVSREIKGYITPDGRAIYIKSDFDNLSNKTKLNERFIEISKTEQEDWVTYFQRLQNDADKGIIIIGVMLNSSGTVGHVMMITPGGLIDIDREEQAWGYTYFDQGIIQAPRVLECGDTDRENEAPLCRNVDRKGAQQRLKWYKYIK